MKRSELIAIEDHNEFMDILSKARMTQNEKAVLIRHRWDYLYRKYRPDDAHIQARRDYSKRS